VEEIVPNFSALNRIPAGDAPFDRGEGPTQAGAPITAHSTAHSRKAKRALISPRCLRAQCLEAVNPGRSFAKGQAEFVRAAEKPRASAPAQPYIPLPRIYLICDRVSFRASFAAAARNNAEPRRFSQRGAVRGRTGLPRRSPRRISSRPQAARAAADYCQKQTTGIGRHWSVPYASRGRRPSTPRPTAHSARCFGPPCWERRAAALAGRTGRAAVGFHPGALGGRSKLARRRSLRAFVQSCIPPAGARIEALDAEGPSLVRLRGDAGKKSRSRGGEGQRVRGAASVGAFLPPFQPGGARLSLFVVDRTVNAARRVAAPAQSADAANIITNVAVFDVYEGRGDRTRHRSRSPSAVTLASRGKKDHDPTRKIDAVARKRLLPEVGSATGRPLFAGG